MTDDAVPQADDTAARAELAGLQEQLKAMRAERDRQVFEKSEIVAKANAFCKERDELRERLSAATAERDRLSAQMAAERDRLSAEKAEAVNKAEEAARRAEDGSRRADAAAAETARLRHVIETAPSSDPAVVLWTLISEKTKALVAWTRAKIPADSSALPWFDRTVETVTKVGCLAVTTADKFLRWALPRLIGLLNRLLREVEARFAKK